ncbi:helix-turn-helix transcriptional regulator [Gordonia neofelifaecis]|uniref:Transcriptional regulator-like protein n=1 Tax=Gordonia neofelifaecis NRRL B-59395 TaxID=644548 RepID=F1YGP9_9ACTN|nr:WYL domain-containing protein [Gordonia neofelifaecis]EGD56197.1 transcriptional regulator-like protein [Gordonia neofelifaecis NRRL B-59395]
MTAKNERLVNLVVCLMSARTFVPAVYIRANVNGYMESEQSADSFKRMLERDKALLREMGIPVETGRNPSGEEGYRIDPDQYALPEITLDRAEAAAIAAASAVWREPSVAAVFQTAVLKLRAAGIEVVPDDEVGVLQEGSARSLGDERAITGLLSAIDVGQPVTFTHRSARGRKTRTLEPWGIAGGRGRWYVTGHDRDRDAVRTFRISRISDVEAFEEPGSVVVPASANIQAIVNEAADLAHADGGATAEVWVAVGRAHGLRRMATSATPHRLGDDDGDLLTIDITSRSGLRRVVLAAGPDAVVLSPADLRADVIAGLDALITMEATA